MPLEKALHVCLWSAFIALVLRGFVDDARHLDLAKALKVDIHLFRNIISMPLSSQLMCAPVSSYASPTSDAFNDIKIRETGVPGTRITPSQAQTVSEAAKFSYTVGSFAIHKLY
jgi:hypothetical protein